MFKHLVIIFSISLFLQSCLTVNTQNVDMIDVDQLQDGSPKIDSVSFTILKSTSRNYISSVSDMKYRNGKFYIFRHQSRTCYDFRQTGQRVRVHKKDRARA